MSYLAIRPTHLASQAFCASIFIRRTNRWYLHINGFDMRWFTIPFPKVLTGGVDKKAVLLNRDTGVVEATLEGHLKPVRDVLFHPREDVLLTASTDRTVRVWRGDGGNYPAADCHVFRAHATEVVDMSLHPTADFLASASLDGSWAFHDLRALRSLASFPSPDGESASFRLQR
jgi:WD40 repeat protein